MMRETHKAVINLFRPKLIPLEHNLVAAVFPLMKIFPAELCLRRAQEEGRIYSQSLVVEAPASNMALSLALVCNLAGYKLTIVNECSYDAFLCRRLEGLGTRLELMSDLPHPEQHQNGNKIAHPCEAFRLQPYDDPANPAAYSFLASQLVENLGHIDCLVASVGSGSSACGTSSFLRELFPEILTIGVDTFGSVSFGQPDRARKIHGLGNSVLSRNLDHKIFDEVHWVTTAEAYRATRLLHQRTTLFCGGTSGAAWLVARYWARKNPKARVVCICPDDGYQYLDSIYSDEYLWKENLWLPELPEIPREVDHPLNAGPSWSYIQWGRRTYSEVVSPPMSASA